jgi:uncharacterized protein (DUF1697 family)
MSAYVALLRGVNLLGASTLKMAELKAMAEELGLASARTLIASGNLLFLSDSCEEELRTRLEDRLRSRMSREVRVMLRTADEMAAVARANPFPDAAANNVQVFFMNEPPPADLLRTVRNRDDERIAAGVREVYVAYGEKGIGRSPANPGGRGRDCAQHEHGGQTG